MGISLRQAQRRLLRPAQGDKVRALSSIRLADPTGTDDPEPEVTGLRSERLRRNFNNHAPQSCHLRERLRALGSIENIGPMDIIEGGNTEALPGAWDNDLKTAT